jgi:glycerate 2-kinase
MRILIAPDKFKGSLGADAVAQAIAAGVRRALPMAEIETIAIADGGEGTAEAICQARSGEWINCPAHDALGRALQSRYAWLAGPRLAVMEMSAAAGLAQLAPDERDPIRASTFGVGELVRGATERGAEQIIIGLGGSATNDGGFGMARAIGFRFWSEGDRELTGPVSELLTLARIEKPDDLRLPSIVAACDVTNPLLGLHGATHTFGAQKGAGPEQIEILDLALSRLAEVAAQAFACDYRNNPGAGAAGGLGFGLLTFCGAAVRSGFEVVAEAIDLSTRIARADFVITGEGKLDRQTLAGKGPAGVARMARELQKPVYAIVGVATDDPEVRQAFEAVIILDDESPGYRNTPQLLETRARELATRLR